YRMLRKLGLYVLFLLVGALLLTTQRSQTKTNAIPTEKDMGAYLFVFFNDPTHSLFMATSRDGYNFTPVNNGQPVMAGDTLASQKGIRDPHIYRGPDGAFYLAMTDLNLRGKEMGFRTTQWERE